MVGVQERWFRSVRLTPQPGVIMRDSFERVAVVTAPATVIWATLHDVSLLASYSRHLGPVTTIEPGRRWKVPLQDRVGLLKLSAPFDVAIVEDIATAVVSIRASGRDKGPGTQLAVEASVRISQEKGNTQLNLAGSYELTGKVVTLGAAVARRRAATMIDEFWTNLTADLTP